MAKAKVNIKKLKKQIVTEELLIDWMWDKLGEMPQEEWEDTYRTLMKHIEYQKALKQELKEHENKGS